MRKLAALVAILALAAVACSGTGDPPPNLSFGRDPGDRRPVELALAGGTGLARFDACADLLDYVHEQTLDAVGPYGLQGVGAGPMMDFATTGGAERAMAMEDSAGGDGALQSAAPAAGGGSAGQEFSGTNVQVEGVDEPDLVKTDGRRMIVVGQGRVHVFDVSAGTPRKLSELDLREEGWDHQLLLDEDRLVVLTRGHRQVEPAAGAPAGDAARPAIDMMPMVETATITVFDLSDAAAPAQVSRLELDGGYVSARLAGGVVRVVTRSQPAALPFAYPMEGTAEEEARLTEHNREVVEASTVDDWLPTYRLESGGTSSSGQLVSCDQVHHPAEFAGPSTLTVVTVDPDDPRPGNAVSILAGAETVYASAEALYVATTDWDQMRVLARGGTAPDEARLATQIHKFDIADPAATRYVGSGTVEGTLLNQFAMDEHEGNLRVASTTMPAWFGGPADGGPVSESFVTVLAERGDGLEQVGRVGGLGRDERIYSVRFMGDLGYVVTFRQVDPLYVVDLSDPTAPAVRGELKILGYSAYLHPVGDGLLLGVGQDATEEGRTQGTQLAIFDVSDPADPRRIHQLRIDDASSSAEYDHHAFLYWAATGLTVLPIQTYGMAVAEDLPSDGISAQPVGPDSWWAGAIAFDVDPSAGIVEQGRITHLQRPDDYMGAIERSVVVGDALYTLSQKGLMASDLDTLTQRAFVEFPVFEQ